VAMFDKLIRKGKQMAGEYVREQLNQRSGNDDQRSDQRGYASGGHPYSNRGYDNEPQRGSAARYGNQQATQQSQSYGAGQPANRQASSSDQALPSREDRAAIAKYQYMLKTAPPEDMEHAHSEAFSRLTPKQRALLQTELSQSLPATERPATDQPRDLARAATRAEVARPGFMEKILGRGGPGASGMAAGAAGGLGVGLLGGVAGAFIGTAIAGPLLDGFSGISEGLSGAAEGLTDGVAGAGEEVLAAGEGLTDQAGGLLGGLFGGGDFGGDGGGFEGFGDFEI